MAFETIDAHRRVTMAHGAKMTGIGHCDRLSAGIIDCVAIQAPLQAVLLGANTIVHRFIALMEYDLHMIAPHERCFFYTLVAFAFGDFRHRHFGVRGQHQHEGERC